MRLDFCLLTMLFFFLNSLSSAGQTDTSYFESADTVYIDVTDTMYVAGETVFLDSTVVIQKPLPPTYYQHRWSLILNTGIAKPFYNFQHQQGRESYTDSVQQAIGYSYR